MTSDPALDSQDMTRKGPWPRRLFIALALLKILGLIAYGPLTQPDTTDYTHTGDIIFETTEWLHDAGLDKEPFPPTIFRTIGYPVLVGGIERLLGSERAGFYGVVVVQIMLSLWATYWVFQLGLAALKSQRWALVAAAGQALSIGFLYDQHILTDSLFNSLFLISICWPAARLLQRRPAELTELFILGLVFTGAALIRSMAAYFWIMPLPIVAIWVFQNGFGNALASVKRMAVYMVLPVMLITGTLSWNHYRTGELVYSTGSQIVMIQSLMIIGKRGTDLFTTDQLIDRVARETITDYSYDNAQAISRALFNDHGIQAIESAKLHSAKWFQVLSDHPGKLLYHGIREYEESLVHQFFNVGDNTRMYFKLAAFFGHYKGMKKAWERLWEEPNVLDAVYVVVLSPMRVFAWACLVFFILGTPIIVGFRLVKGRALTSAAWRENIILTLLWGIHLSYAYGLCMIHMVDRFYPAVLAAGLVPVLYTYKLIWDWKQARRAGAPS